MPDDNNISKCRGFHPAFFYRFLFSFFLIFTLSFNFPSTITIIAQELPDTSFRSMENTAFKRGEFLKYRVFYDSWMTHWITAGIGTMHISNLNEEFHGRPTYHIEVHGFTQKPFSWFFKVRDKFESYMDEQALMPWRFIRRTKEGGYVVNDDVDFNQFNQTAQSSRKLNETTPYVQDIVSAFYYMRNLNYDTAKINDEYFINFYLDDSVYSSKIIFLGREVVETELGRFNCIKFKPSVATGEVFQEKYPMELWVTDDENKIPVLGKSKVFVGSVTVELIGYDGLKNPSSKVSKD